MRILIVSLLIKMKMKLWQFLPRLYSIVCPVIAISSFIRASSCALKVAEGDPELLM